MGCRIAIALAAGLLVAACSAANADDAVPSSASSEPPRSTPAQPVATTQSTSTTPPPSSPDTAESDEQITATTEIAVSAEDEPGEAPDTTATDSTDDDNTATPDTGTVDTDTGDTDTGDTDTGDTDTGDTDTGDTDTGDTDTGDTETDDTETGQAVEDVPLVGDTEDPSFELGPDVLLDVDVARFPEDDAGIGGGPTPQTPDEPDDAGPTPTPVGWTGVDRFLESVLIRPGNTAASVAVSIDGDVVHRAAFGVRDSQTGDPAEPLDRFRIASISKPITAITVMAMVEDGVIGLDEPLGDLVARHVGLGSANRASASLTFRQLLSHRSGFGKYDGAFFRGAAVDCTDAARTGLSSGSGGGGYTYSNMNFCVAGLAIEAITGLTYEQAVYQYLLTPLGISGMRLAPTSDPGPDEVQHVTTPGRNYMETLGAAGAWIATPSDLVTIFDSLDVDSGGFKPLTVETVLQMFTPPGGEIGQRGYGLGVISYGNNRYGHTGTIESTHAMVLNRGDGVIWSITVAGQFPGESTSLERIMNDAFVAGGFVAG